MDLQIVITYISLFVNILAIISFVRKYHAENTYGEMIGEYYVTGSIFRCYKSFLGRVHFGKPLTEEYDAVSSPAPYCTQGFVQRFEGYGDDVEHEHRGKKFRAISIYKSRRGTFGVYGVIGQAYEENGGTNSKLGFPKSNEKVIKGQKVQFFEGGRVYDDKRIEYYK